MEKKVAEKKVVEKKTGDTVAMAFDRDAHSDSFGTATNRSDSIPVNAQRPEA
jgi:hypothetical protein